MPRPAPAPQHFERRVEGIAYGVLDELVGYALRRAQIAIYEDFEAALGPIAITPQRFSALVVISRNPGISQSRLGSVLGIARSGVNQLVNALAAQGWVSRAQNDADGRQWLLSLTDAGRDHLANARRRVRSHDSRVSKRLSAAERDQLMSLLDRLGAP